MVFGHVDDEAKEFFIQRKTTPQTNTSNEEHLTAEQRILSQLAQAKLHTDQTGSYRSHNRTQANGDNFNWYTTFSLRLENIPDSHISSSLASKIIFAGKAAKLLQTTPIHQSHHHSRRSHSQANGANNKSEAFEYLSRGNDFDFASDIQDDGKSHRSTLDSLLTVTPDMPYSREEIEFFDSQFKLILTTSQEHDDTAIEKLEKAIETVSTTVSTRLWTLLRDNLGFSDHLHIIRNTYLMGKGELMQCIVDDLHALMHQNTPKMSETLDEILNFQVLRHASKLLGFADEDLGKLLQLRIQSNNVTVSQYHREDDRFVTMNGAASHAYPLTTSHSQSIGKGIFNPVGINLCIPVSPPEAEVYAKLWKDRYILNLSHGHNDDTADVTSPWTAHNGDYEEENEGSIPEENKRKSKQRNLQKQGKEPKYLNAAVWLTDTKFVSKGFHFAVTFSSSWTHAHLMNGQHPLMLQSQRAKDRLLWPKLPLDPNHGKPTIIPMPIILLI